MSQTLTLKQISDKISHLEEEVDMLRKELAELRQQKKDFPTSIPPQIAYTWTDKNLQRRWIDQLFTSLSIQGEPIGPLELQQKMGQAGLIGNELSRDLIEAREE